MPERKTPFDWASLMACGGQHCHVKNFLLWQTST